MFQELPVLSCQQLPHPHTDTNNGSLYNPPHQRFNPNIAVFAQAGPEGSPFVVTVEGQPEFVRIKEPREISHESIWTTGGVPAELRNS
jgi:hypothetical protein